MRKEYDFTHGRRNPYIPWCSFCSVRRAVQRDRYGVPYCNEPKCVEDADKPMRPIEGHRD